MNGFADFLYSELVRDFEFFSLVIDNERDVVKELIVTESFYWYLASRGSGQLALPLGKAYRSGSIWF